MEKHITFNVSSRTIIKIVLIILGLVFLYLIRDILLLVFIVLIIVAGLNPILMFFDKFKIPRWISVSIAYLLLFAFAALLLYIIIPPAIEQTASLISSVPHLISKLPSSISIYINDKVVSDQQQLFSLSQQLKNISQSLMSYITSFFGSITAMIMILVISFYLLLKHDSVEETFFSFVPEEKRKHSIEIYNKISIKIGNWFRNRILLSLIITVVVFVFLRILNIPYALSLGVLAGILDVVPIIGPIVVAIITALIIALTGIWWQILASLIFYIVLHEIEDNYLGPKLLGKAIGLSPVIIILVFAIGAKLGGIVGAILSIPIAAGVYVLIQNWPYVKKNIFN